MCLCVFVCVREGVRHWQILVVLDTADRFHCVTIPLYPSSFLFFSSLVGDKQNWYGGKEPTAIEGDERHPPDEGPPGEHCQRP